MTTIENLLENFKKKMALQKANPECEKKVVQKPDIIEDAKQAIDAAVGKVSKYQEQMDDEPEGSIYFEEIGAHLMDAEDELMVAQKNLWNLEKNRDSK